MICGSVLMTQNGEVVALCKEAEHEGEWHEANEVRLDHSKVVMDIRWRNVKEEE